MQLAEMQVIARNVIIISVALLAITLVVISPTWRNCLCYFRRLLARGHRGISIPFVVISLGSLIPFGTLLTMSLAGYGLPRGVFDYLYLGWLVFTLEFAIYLAITIAWYLCQYRRFLRFRRSEEPTVQLSEEIGTLFYLISLYHLVLAGFLFTGSMVSAMDMAISITLGPITEREFFNSLLMLRAAAPTLFFGLLFLGCGKVIDLLRTVILKMTEVQDSAPENLGPKDQDEAGNVVIENYQESSEEFEDNVAIASPELEAGQTVDVVVRPIKNHMGQEG